MYICKSTSLLTGGSSTYKTSAGDWTGIGRFVKRFLMFLAAGHDRAPLESYDIFYTKIVQCPSDVCKLCPADAILSQ